MTATLPDWMPFPAEAEQDGPGAAAPAAGGSGQPGEPLEPRRPVPPALQPWHDPRPALGWLLTAAVTALAMLTRFWALGFPNVKMFDEAYYPVEAQEILRFGYEDNRGYMFIVHPPLGKWLIAWSTELFGNGMSSAFGWRVAPAVFGTLTVIVVARTARRMTRSNVFGAIGGLLITFDGLSLVLARTAILDVFLQFFVIAAFGCLVIDRDQMRARLALLLAEGADLGAGVPALGPRPWRLLAGVCFGLGCAVKWTGLSFFVLFGLLSLLWDRGAFRAAGVRRPSRAVLRRSVPPAGGSLLLAPAGAYLLCYLGWFVGENSWGRHYADNHSASTRLNLPLGIHLPVDWGWLPGPIRSLGSYTLNAYRFHEGLDSGHSYASGPWSWLVLGRPVDFYYNGDSTACGAATCSREVLLIGTPALWWAFAPLVLWLAWHYATTRDWRAAAVLVGFVAGWGVWFQDLKRTMFLFYMAPLVPLLVLGCTLALGMLLGPGRRRTGDPARDRSSGRRRRIGMAATAGYLALVAVDFAWMWPVLTGGLVSYDVWHAHMWLPSWV